MLNLILIPRMGITGAALAWAVSIALNNLLPALQVHVMLGINAISRRLLVPGLASVACFAGLGLVIRSLVGQSFVALALAIVLGGTIYLAVVWRYRRLLRVGALGNVLRRPRKSRADAAGRWQASDAALSPRELSPDMIEGPQGPSSCASSRWRGSAATCASVVRVEVVAAPDVDVVIHRLLGRVGPVVGVRCSPSACRRTPSVEASDAGSCAARRASTAPSSRVARLLDHAAPRHERLGVVLAELVEALEQLPEARKLSTAPPSADPSPTGSQGWDWALPLQ